MPVSSSPPRAPPIKYTAPLGTRWAKEKAAAGGVTAFDLPTDPKNIGPWILGECVGKGASGRVKIAKHRLTGQLAAVKILPVAPLVNSRASLATQQAKSDKQRLGIDREITMMKLMNHPNIMRIYDVFEGDKELFLVLEYVEGGELFDFLVNRGRLPPGEALAYFKQIVYGLNYAHTFSIIHRDLKPENILIASLSPPVIKIADWGMAAFAPPSLKLETSCGSPHYASPEIVNGEKYEGNATDIWSCGVILYALLTGRLPFDDKNVRTLLTKVKSGKYEMPAWIDPLAKDLLGRMLVVDVHKRITIPEILNHPWLASTASFSLTQSSGTMKLTTPPLPPSPSILARPIASPSLIDPDLLSSLRVIWGRHTDPRGESIKKDLCAPAGRGVHAKAFYFLLGRYRDESLRNSFIDHEEMEGEMPMRFNLGWDLDLNSGVTKKYEGNRNSMLSVTIPRRFSRTPSPAPIHPSGPAPPLMSRTNTNATAPARNRPASPAGPRAPPLAVPGKSKLDFWRAQDQDGTDPTANFPILEPAARPTSSLGITPSDPRPRHPKRTYSRELPSDGRGTGARLPQHLQRLQTNTLPQPQRPKSALGVPASCEVVEKKNTISHPRPASHSGPTSTLIAPVSSILPSTTIHAPVPMSVPVCRVRMPAVGALDRQVSSVLPARTDGVTDKVDEAAAAAQSIQVAEDRENIQSVVPDTISTNRSRYTTRRESATSQTPKALKRINDTNDKENQSIGDEEWSYIVAEDARDAGIGLGMGRDIGREMGNVIYLGDGNSGLKGKKEKEKKGRSVATVSNAHPINTKRSTMLGSPIALSVGPAPSNTGRLMTSPVVGEFKGWFSNLFNWKAHHSNGHGGILYSVEDVVATRAEVCRILEAFGVVVERHGFDSTSPDDLIGPLKCRVEESSVDALTNLTLKPVRFRVEFSSTGNFPKSTFSPNLNSQSGATPKPLTNALATPNLITPRVRTSILMNKSSHDTPISPNLISSIGFPPGYVSAIILIQERGSMTTFRTVWRRLKEVYGNGSTAHPSLSPTMTNTPLLEYPQRFAI